MEQLGPDYEALNKAVYDYIESQQHGDVVIEWGLIIATHVLNSDDSTATGYYIRTSQEIAHHRILGLFSHANMLVANGMPTR